MDRLLDICDEMASGADYVSLRDVVERFYGCEISKLDNDKEYSRLRRHLNRYSKIIDYKNGRDFRNGFRYKSGSEFYFRKEEQKVTLNKLRGDEKRLYLTGGLQILFEGKSSPEHLIELECVPDLKNKELVKELVGYLGKLVISFKYIPGYDDSKKIRVVIHPHLLKEYNSRWFLFGYVHQQDDSWEIINVALDRIIYKPGAMNILPHADVPFKPVPKAFYCNYFKDIVGVTRFNNREIEEIVIRTVDFKVHHLLQTKKIHPSQVESLKFDKERGYGEFTIRVIPNIELQTRLLGYGSGIYVMGGSSFHKRMKDVIEKMAKLY